jgi:hypothetical protein
MPVKFDPLPIPKFDASLLSYLSRSFERIRDAINGVGQRLTIEPFTYKTSLANGTATTYTVFYTQSNILTAKFPITMIVDVVGMAGFAGVAGDSRWWVREQNGNDITLSNTPTFVPDGMLLTINVEKRSFNIKGVKNYNPGEVVGFQLAYLLSGAGNVYADLSVEVKITARS